MNIPDSLIVEWLRSGLMQVDLITCELTFRGRTLKAFLVSTDTSGTDRYAFGLRFNGDRRTIQRAKLVYMAGTLAEIPEGFEVHHVNSKRHDDRFANLAAMSSDDHKKLHGTYYETADNIPF